MLSTSGGLGEAETSGVFAQRDPARGRQHVQRQRSWANGASGAWQASNYTQSLKDQGLRAPTQQACMSSTRWAAAASSATSCGSTLSYRAHRDRQLGPRDVCQPERRQSERVERRFRHEQAGQYRYPGSNPGRANHVAGNTAQQVQPELAGGHLSLGGWNGGGSATTTIEASNPSRMDAVPPAGRDVVVANHEPAAGRRRAGARSWGGIAIPRPRVDGTHNPRMIRAQEQSALYGIPNLTYRMPGRCGRRLQSPSDRVESEPPRVALVRDRRAQHEVRIPGRIQQSEPDLSGPQRSDARSAEQRPSEPVDAGDHRPTTRRPASRSMRNLWPTSFYAQDQWTRRPADAARRNPIRLVPDQLPPNRGSGGRAIRPRRSRKSCMRRARRSRCRWHDLTPRMGVAYDLFGKGKTAVKFNLGKYMQERHGGQQRLRSEPDHPHGDQHDADVDRHESGFRPRTATWRIRDENGECAAMNNANLGKEVFDRTYDPNFVEGSVWRPYLVESGRLGAAGSDAEGFGERRLLPQLVGQLVHRGQPHERVSRTGRPSASRRRSTGGCRVAAGQVISGLYNLVPAAVGKVDELGDRFEEHRRADRELAGRRFRRQRTSGCGMG